MRFDIGNLPQFGNSPLSNKQGVSITCLPASSPIDAGKRMAKDGQLLNFTFGANPELLRVRRELRETAKNAVDYIKERDKKPEGKRKFGLLKYAKLPLFSLAAFGLLIGSFFYINSKYTEYTDYSFNASAVAEERSFKLAQDGRLSHGFNVSKKHLAIGNIAENTLLPVSDLSLGNSDRDFTKLLDLIEFGTSMEMEAAIFTLCLYANAGDINAINYLFNLAQDGNFVALEALLGLAEWEENQLIRDMLNNMDVSTLALLAASDNKALGILAKLSYNYRYMTEGDLIGFNDEAFTALAEIAASGNNKAVALLGFKAYCGDKRALNFFRNVNREVINIFINQANEGSLDSYLALDTFRQYANDNAIVLNAKNEIDVSGLLSAAINGEAESLIIISLCQLKKGDMDILRELDIAPYITLYNSSEGETWEQCVRAIKTLAFYGNVRAGEFLDSNGLGDQGIQEDSAGDDAQEESQDEGDAGKIIKDAEVEETINEQFAHIGGASSALRPYINKTSFLAKNLLAWVNLTLNTGNINVNLPDNLYARRLFSKVKKRINSDVASFAINEYQGTNSGASVLYLPTINIKDSDLGYDNTLGPRKQQLRNSYDSVSRLPLIRDVRLPDKDILLVSSMVNGTSGVVKLGFLPDGRPVALKSYFPSNFTADYKRDINDFLLEDYNAAIFAEDLGIGPQVHGVFLDGARPWLVMDVVTGDFIHKAGRFVNLQTFEDLLEIKNRLEDAGRYFGQDFQYFVSSDGHVKVIDQAGLFSDYQGVVVGDAMYVSIIEKILFNTNIRTRDKIIHRIYESSPYLLSDIAKISTLSVKKHINTFLSAKKFYLDRNLSGYFSKKKFMPSVEEVRLKLSAKIKLLAGRNLPVNVEVVGNESGRNSLLFYLHIGNRRWVVKFADYKGNLDINAIVWSKELLISELARKKGFFSDIAANNPVDFLNALGFLRESALLHDAVADMKHIDWRTLHRLMKDFFMIDDLIFTVSSYVQGKSEWEDFSVLPREDRIVAIREVARIVSLLHQNNVFHRDLRPEQIIFNKADERIVLIDFENSVIFDNNDQLTFGFPYSNTYYSLPEMVAKYFRPSNKDLFMLQDRFALAYMKKELELGERVPFNFSADLKSKEILALLKTTSFQRLLEKPDILLSLVQGVSSAINVNVKNNKGLKDNVLVESKDKFSSSPVKEKDRVFNEASLVSKQNNTFGGIDFRSLPIVTQAASNLGLSTMSHPSTQLGVNELRNRLLNFNLHSELNEIERLNNAGITPSTQRIKEYIQASSISANSPEDNQKLLSCIAGILRKQEEECCATDPTLKDILVVLESGLS
jgi:serine/threonine protein kinase